jgi:hypothetical protein
VSKLSGWLSLGGCVTKFRGCVAKFRGMMTNFRGIGVEV